MATVFLRTIIIYVILIAAMRLMGKRQIGELEISDLVTTLLISEIATLPITDGAVPISHAIVPIVILITFEISSSALVALFPKIKNLITDRPSTLIRDGKLCRRAMLDSRISLDELITELRQSGYVDINEIRYAILEKNGKITLIPKAKYNVPTCEQMNIKADEQGIFHIIIDNGVLNSHGLLEVGLNKGQIEHKLKKYSLGINDVYLMMISDGGEERLISKKEAE